MACGNCIYCQYGSPCPWGGRVVTGGKGNTIDEAYQRGYNRGYRQGYSRGYAESSAWHQGLGCVDQAYHQCLGAPRTIPPDAGVFTGAIT